MRTGYCYFALLFAALLFALSGAQTTRLYAQGTPPPGHPPIGGAANAAPTYAGQVLETMDSGAYTYVLVDAGTEKVWAAGSQFEVKVGDRVSFGGGLPMANFHSKTLNRDFEMIYFTGGIRNESRPGAVASGDPLPKGHPDISGQTSRPNLDVSNIKKARDGRTIEEVFADKASLAGKEVKVRGKVVKVSSQIMGKNWIHIKDGTGKKGTDDLTVTTEAEAKVGDVVLVTGKVAVDKDFGYNYQYPVMIEEAKLKVE